MAGRQTPVSSPQPERIVFLTGATGTVGSGILEALAADSTYEVHCLIRKPKQKEMISRMGGTPVFGDMTDENLFARLRVNTRYDFIIHAAQAHYRDTPREEIDRIERCAVRNLEMIVSPNTRLMIFTSGVWSYGNGAEGRPIHERILRQPFAAAQGRTTLVREVLANSNYPWAELCPPSLVYGSVGPLADIISSLRNGTTLEAPADLAIKWSLIERLDLGRAFRALLEVGRPGDSFVVAEDEAIPISEVYETVQALVGRGSVIKKSRKEFATTLDPENLAQLFTSQPVDSSLFKQRTGWRARHFFKDAVKCFLSKRDFRVLFPYFL